MKLRFAVPRDAKRIAEIDLLCFSMPWSKESLEEDIAENEKAVYIVAEEEERIAGYAGMWITLDEAHITNVAVHPKFRGRGIGTNLMVALLRLAKRYGAVHQTLEVRVSNKVAISLYEGLGFEGVGVRKSYYLDNNEDALIMWRHDE